jgi:hypothetical protein
MPQDWRDIFGETEGLVQFQRTFHSPTNLEPGTQIDLVFEGLGGEARIVLNDHAVTPPDSPADSPLRFEITETLQPSNNLRVEIQFDPEHSSEPGGLWGMVVLEIRD